MIYLHVFNYSSLDDAKIEGCIKSFLKHLKEKGIEKSFKVELCGESTKNRFNEIIYDDSKSALSNDNDFESAVYTYHGELSNNEYGINYKFIFIGETLKTDYPWGDARGDWFAVIKNLQEKAIWHEIAHLIGAKDHYNVETHAPLSICRDHQKCLMTWGNSSGELLCSASLQEIRLAMSGY